MEEENLREQETPTRDENEKRIIERESIRRDLISKEFHEQMTREVFKPQLPLPDAQAHPEQPEALLERPESITSTSTSTTMPSSTEQKHAAESPKKVLILEEKNLGNLLNEIPPNFRPNIKFTVHHVTKRSKNARRHVHADDE